MKYMQEFNKRVALDDSDDAYQNYLKEIFHLAMSGKSNGAKKTFTSANQALRGIAASICISC